jgi:hypothetical protein
MEIKEDPKAFMARIQAARMGCPLCGAALRIPPTGELFSQGPYVGRYWCMECWTLYWDEHPEGNLADEESRKYVSEEARRIRLKRGSEVLFEEGENRVYKTPKGTIVFDFRIGKELAPNEYDPARLALLQRALRAIEARNQAVNQAG